MGAFLCVEGGEFLDLRVRTNETDFSMNGLGPVMPSSVSETLNGEWELGMVHPIDEFGKWRRLDYGYILRAPVPAACMPRVKMVAVDLAANVDKLVVQDKHDVLALAMEIGSFQRRAQLGMGG